MKIQPFRAWRYNEFLRTQLPELTAPLSETNLQQKQAYFYQQPFHYFHISAPIDVPPYHNPQRRVENWKLDKVVLQDKLPAIYAYSQTYTLHKEPTVYTQIGVVCLIESTDYAQKQVLPHENTISKAVKHRQELLEATHLHTVPTHLLYTDITLHLDKYLHEALLHPMYEITDKHDTIHRLAAIHDRKIIDLFASQLAEKQLIIADGHHRYESSVAYKNAQQTPTEEAGYHLAWLTNTASYPLGILPTHRLAKKLTNFDSTHFLSALQADFEVLPTTRHEERGLAPTENLWTFLLILPEGDYLLCLKPEAFANSTQEAPEVIKRLDLSVMHHFIFEKHFNLQGERQYEHIDYTQYVSQAYKEVMSGEANFALLTRRITFAEIEAVCQAGHTMPAKATYFFPKVLGGMVFAQV